jgi:ubiquinone/menaquinone biosynthesis C-methylase UbiE
MKLTERQAREVDYHRGHAACTAANWSEFTDAAATSPRRRWWNAYWSTWTYLRALPLEGVSVLVVGCGAGSDAMLFARLGADVSAFDLSPNMLTLARQHAEREGLCIRFDECQCEALVYTNRSFDLIFVRDVLHHVEIPAAMCEIARVARPDALLVIDEIYSHSWTELVRRSRFVDGFLYPLMVSWIYVGKNPYITADERKMTEADIELTLKHTGRVETVSYYNMIVTRILPDRWPIVCKLDRLLLIALGSLGRLFAGRIVVTARMP